MLFKNALRKDTFREIKFSLSRFLSIFAIVALGSGFLVGLKATSPNMKKTALNYFENQNLMDLKLMTTLGISAEDVSAVNEVEGVTGVMPSYTQDLFVQTDGESLVMKAISYNKRIGQDEIYNINRPVVLEGRMPEKSGECAIELKLTSPESFKIGNTIKFTTPDETKPMSDYLKTDSYKIVGIISSPSYIGYKRGQSKIGNGKIESFVLLPEEDFNLPYYTELFATVEGLDDIDPFSEEYSNKLNKYVPQIKDALSKSVNERYEKLLAEANRNLENAKGELEGAKYLASADYNTLVNDIKKGEETVRNLNIQYDQQDSAGDSKKNLTKALIVQTQNKINLAKSKIQMIETNTLPSSAETEKEIAGYEQQIKTAQLQIESFKEPVVYSFDRNSNEDYANFSNDSEKVDSVSKVFPIFFILVAALVCLTTMSRMVEENRTQIGTLKALGYSKSAIALKFLIYGVTATTLGCFFGMLLGFKTLPLIIFDSYKLLYNIPGFVTPFRWNYALITYLIALVCVIFVILYACLNELKSNPAQIMRPKSPPKGKRVLLERFPFIWNKFSFLRKVTFRNLFRYKKRFFMAVIGIAGCTALMLAGFGVNNSVSSIAIKQFDSVFVFDGMAAVKEDTDITKTQELFNNNFISDNMQSYQANFDLKNNKGIRNVNLLIPQNANDINKYIHIQERVSGKKLKLNDSGIIINEKLAKLLEIKVGDTVTIENLEHQPKKVKVTGINENYTLHYIYMTPALYNSIYGENPKYNSIVFNMNDPTSANEDKLSSSLLKNDDILGIQYSSTSGKTFFTMTKSLNSIVLVLIICAGLLAFIVLYNLSNINITERLRELATIKVLGFYDNEVSNYINRENTVSTIIGMILGLILGVFLHRFVIVTAEVDIVMFNRLIEWQSFVYSGALTLLFTFIVNFILHFKLKKVDMVESLKSIE